MTTFINRREFLAESGSAVLIAASAPALSRFRFGSRLRVGVIGLGNRGRAVADAFARSPDAQIVALCDASPAMIRGAVRRWPTLALARPRLFTDATALLEEGDVCAVVVAVPATARGALTETAARAGKHIFVEAPAITSPLDAIRVLRAIDETGAVVQHGLLSRASALTSGTLRRPALASGARSAEVYSLTVVRERILRQRGQLVRRLNARTAAPSGIDLRDDVVNDLDLAIQALGVQSPRTVLAHESQARWFGRPARTATIRLGFNDPSRSVVVNPTIAIAADGQYARDADDDRLRHSAAGIAIRGPGIAARFESFVTEGHGAARYAYELDALVANFIAAIGRRAPQELIAPLSGTMPACAAMQAIRFALQRPRLSLDLEPFDLTGPARNEDLRNEPR